MKTMSNDAAQVFGRLYAIIDHLTTPQGLSATAINNISQAPGLYLGQHTRVIVRNPNLTVDLDARITELMGMITPEDLGAYLTVEQQGIFQLGFFHERGDLPDDRPETPGGRPRAGEEKVDWSTVDWTLGDAELARKLGVRASTVWSQRRRHGNKVE